MAETATHLAVKPGEFRIIYKGAVVRRQVPGSAGIHHDQPGVPEIPAVAPPVGLWAPSSLLPEGGELRAHVDVVGARVASDPAPEGNLRPFPRRQIAQVQVDPVRGQP